LSEYKVSIQYSYVIPYEKYSAGASIRYGQAEPWKVVYDMAGRTHPERDPRHQPNRSGPIRNDGRRFDTAAELLRFRKKGLPTDSNSGTAEETGKSSSSDVPPEGKAPPKSPKLLVSMPGAKWAKNSCWFDAGFQLMYVAVARDFKTFEERFAGLADGSLMQMFYQQFKVRKLLYADTKVTRQHSILRLQETRDTYRKYLSSKRMLAGDGPFEFEPIFVKSFYLNYYHSLVFQGISGQAGHYQCPFNRLIQPPQPHCSQVEYH
jgi:hypothetical protein